MFWICEYIKYLLNRKNKFGVHSPFIYNLLINLEKTEVDEKLSQIKKEIKKYYLNNYDKIVINDLGVGSKIKKNNIRIISEIFKNSSSNGKYSDLLYKLSKNYANNNILELGTNLGYGTLHLSLGNIKSFVYTVEGCRNIISYPIKLFKKYQINNVEFINSSFQEFLEKQDNIFDLIFIDGHHQSSALQKYLNLLLPYIHDNTIIIFDDIRWNKDMLNFWNSCVSNNEFNVSIDFFRMGIIVKKTGQAKEHFVLKI